MPFKDFLLQAGQEDVEFFFEDPPTSPKIVALTHLMKLRSLDSSGTRFAPPPFGSYQEAIFQTRTWRPTEIDSFFGFTAYCVLNGGAIGFQLSANDGATWLRWDGVNWIAAGTDFNTDLEVDEGIKTFPFQDSIRFRVRLTPSTDGFKTPILRFFRIFCEYRCFGMMDDVFRSWVAFISDHCKYRLIHLEDLAASNLIEIEDRFPVLGDVHVFDLAFDPNKRDNIVASVNGQDITLNAPVTGEVEVQFKSLPDIHIMTDAGLELSELPAITVQFTSITPDEMISRNDEVAFDQSNKLARIREVATRYKIVIEIKVLTHNKYRATMISGAVRRCVEKQSFISSLATDDRYTLLPPTGSESQEDRPTENLLVHKFEVEAEWVDWGGQPDAEEVPVVEEVSINIWPSGDSCLEGD